MVSHIFQVNPAKHDGIVFKIPCAFGKGYIKKWEDLSMNELTKGT